MASDDALPEIFVDFNGYVKKRDARPCYLLTRGTYDDLARLGLTVEQAVGKRFAFNGGGDTDENGVPSDIMSAGTIVRDEDFDLLAQQDSEIYWRPLG